MISAVEKQKEKSVKFFASCQPIIHKICTNLNSEQYRERKKQHFPYMSLRSHSNTFSFFEQSNSDISLINSGFNNFLF